MRQRYGCGSLLLCSVSGFLQQHNVKSHRSCRYAIPSTTPRLGATWFPTEFVGDESTQNIETQHFLEEASVNLTAQLISNTLNQTMGTTTINNDSNHAAIQFEQGRFVDFCCLKEGEEILERLFYQDTATEMASNDPRIVQGAVICLQRLLIFGTTYGLTANAELVAKGVQHLSELEDEENNAKDVISWTPESTRRLKYQAALDGTMKTPAIQLLAALKKRQTPLGAYELLVKLGVWKFHENLALIRSGLRLSFSQDEERAAKDAINNDRDPDEVLGVRIDLRNQKVVTIDGPNAAELDDGLSVERITNKDGDICYKYWIHIADADRYAPRDSKLFQVARRRATSIYLPNRSISMLPASMSREAMSLTANQDKYALSLSVELANDGSILEDSIQVMPSRINIDYRLTYEAVDEMLADGIAYQEEWELSALYNAALKRKERRRKNGSTDSFVPSPIPKYDNSTFPDASAPAKLGIKLKIQTDNNAGKSQVDAAGSVEEPVSSANILVTEMMILAGEALGKWAAREASPDNPLQLPYRSQAKPNFQSRAREKKILRDLMEYNVGDGYCHAWFARRFLNPAKVTTTLSHSGLGLSCYVQWTSPLRRFQDLQVRAAVKRHLRRKKVLELKENGEAIPNSDLGCEQSNGSLDLDFANADQDIDYQDRTKLLGPVSFVMRHSQKYWMLEYIRRLQQQDPAIELECVVLGCTNPSKRQYAVYVYDLGLEWKYSSPVGLQAGNRFRIRIGTVVPQNGQLSLVRAP